MHHPTRYVCAAHIAKWVRKPPSTVKQFGMAIGCGGDDGGTAATNPDQANGAEPALRVGDAGACARGR